MNDGRSPAPAPAGLSAAAVAALFGAFAATYFLSALLRAVTATLAPVFSAELGLTAGHLGLLAGAFFLGFAAMQLPLGRALDRFGPRRTLLVLLALAMLGCIAFAHAGGLGSLVLSRMLIGVGVSACLMAPLTSYRRWLTPMAQLRANSWMLMTGSLGMVASTLPVQWLLPLLGWRGVFWGLAGLLALATGLVAWFVPRDAAPPAAAGGSAGPERGTYGQIVRHRLFVRMAPAGFFIYGGLIAVQALWAGPWMTRVAGLDAGAAARGLFAINVAMLFTFMTWGMVLPRLARRGIDALRLMRWGLPVCLAVLLGNLWLGPAAGAWHWAAWCVACSFVSVSQPAVGAAFPTARAGRALSAFNLVIFSGVFSTQWGIGLLVDAALALGAGNVAAYRVAFGVFAACSLASYLWLLREPAPVADNPDSSRRPSSSLET
ncbi:MAG: MFS transporter [Burkholderiales bacterium]|nr:MFS transporter [Burkholderiales bacterium]